MIIYESIDVAISYNFMISVFIIAIGAFLTLHIARTYISQCKGVDLSRRLTSQWYLLLLRAFHIPFVRIIIVGLMFCSPVITIHLAMDFYYLSKDGCLRCLPSRNYVDGNLVAGMLAIGYLIHLILGDKGFSLSIGNGLIVSFDKENAIAIHIHESTPKAQKYIDIIVPTIKKLRKIGVRNKLTFRSWALVTKLPRHNESVKNIRRLFIGISERSFRLEQAPLPSFISTCGVSPKKGTAIKLALALPVLTKDVIRTSLYAIFIFCSWRKHKKNLPATSLRRTAHILIKEIENETSEIVELINPSPVSFFKFINLGVKLPHICHSFSGLDGGFTVSPRQIE